MHPETKAINEVFGKCLDWFQEYKGSAIKCPRTYDLLVSLKWISYCAATLPKESKEMLSFVDKVWTESQAERDAVTQENN